MAFFEFTPAQNYRPKTVLMVQPARKVPTVSELGFRTVEGIKTSVLMQGLLAKEKVTVKDTGCGVPTKTGALARFVTNAISVDPLEAYDEDCAETFLNTILQGMLAKGHATDSDLTGTQIEALVKAYAEGGSPALNAIADANQGIEFQNLLNLTLNDQVTGVVYKDALRIFMLGDKTSADKDYNSADGLRKKLLAATAGAGSTGANGAYRGPAINYTALVADPSGIEDVLEDLVTGCSDELQDIDDEQKAIYLTKSLYRIAKKSAQTLPTLANPKESAKLEYDKNTKQLTYDGFRIIELKVWEQYMKNDFSTLSPHLAMYTVPSNVIWATDLESDMTTAEFKYESRLRINWYRVLFRLGAGFAYDILVSFAI
ncbi:MAG: hypothetical protein ACRYFV_01615 [Janthinobacterium lividum]